MIRKVDRLIIVDEVYKLPMMLAISCSHCYESKRAIQLYFLFDPEIFIQIIGFKLVIIHTSKNLNKMKEVEVLISLDLLLDLIYKKKLLNVTTKIEKYQILTPPFSENYQLLPRVCVGVNMSIEQIDFIILTFVIEKYMAVKQQLAYEKVKKYWSDRNRQKKALLAAERARQQELERHLDAERVWTRIVNADRLRTQKADKALLLEIEARAAEYRKDGARAFYKLRQLDKVVRQFRRVSHEILSL